MRLGTYGCCRRAHDVMMKTLILKISVLSSGVVLLDGRPIDPDRLEKALEDAKEKNGAVAYYSEATPAGPSAQAATTMSLIIKHKLPIRLSRTPDFADRPSAGGLPQPKITASQPHTTSVAKTPSVETHGDMEKIFANVRRTAQGTRGLRCLVIVRPDLQYLVLPALTETPEIATRAADLERLIPSEVKRNVAVIGHTGFTSEELEGSPVPSIKAASRSIPFLGLLMSLSHIGHAVWVFEGHPSALAAGCRDADVLIVDGGMLSLLQQSWVTTASAAMRNANILVH